MAKKVKSRVVSVRLMSMALTGFFYQFTRPRTSPPMSMLKYDPIGTMPTPSPLPHRIRPSSREPDGSTGSTPRRIALLHAPQQSHRAPVPNGMTCPG
ncbi:hypothetical protein J7T55_004409 [Diaporthe amygdali]|uniref:uncharacterized protein n=1 Tax=Phomopsis amygdali TaxID=1214568 RepID=UPI0022FDC1C6|nr:uncharacterized protein J7T55_004409 [Diaporthe amygdali]KAJ0109859.1 hypothetical protein J7T55_004409 [Diaporthe amygdali]